MLCAGANFCLLKTFSQAEMEEKTLVRGTVVDHLFSWFSYCPLIRKLFIGPKSDHCLVLLVTPSVLLWNFAQIVGFFKVVLTRWISLSLDLSILIHGFLSVVT